MKALLLMILLVPAVAAAQEEKKAAEDSTLDVVKFSLKRDKRYTGGGSSRPAYDMPVAGDTSRSGQSSSARRPSASPAAAASRLPGEASIEEQSGAMRQVEARDRRSGTYSAQEFYRYKVKLLNTDAREVRAVYWSFETRQSLRPDDVARREFFCSAKIKPGKSREFEAQATRPPSLTARAEIAAGPDQVVINRVEYKDGSFWQRPRWSHYPITSPHISECVEILSPEYR